MPRPVVNPDVPIVAVGVQVIPSELVATAFVPAPTAIHNDPFHATPYPDVVNGFVVTSVQLTPSLL